MSICSDIFQKDIYQLTVSDLEAFFSVPQEETSILEFKMGKVEREDVYKEVVAFLNTGGGILILGAPIEQKVGDKKISRGALTPCSKITNQDDLIRSIASNIAPSPAGITAITLTIPDGNIFVLEIPQSLNPPHQAANEGKYYIRLERDAKAAPHGIVEALFFKRQKSDVKGNVGITDKISRKSIKLKFLLENDAVIHAEQVGVLLEIYGCKTVIKTNMSSHTFDDGLFKFHAVQSDSLLVRGMTISYDIDVTLYFPIVGYLFSYYSRDNKLQFIKGIYDTLKNEHIHVYDSLHPELSIKGDIDLFDNYLSILQDQFKLIFRNSNQITNLNQPANYEQIAEVEHALDTQFPSSYKDFLTAINGGDFQIDNYRIRFYSLLEIISEISERPTIHPDAPFTIGRWNDFPILMNTHNSQAAQFTWVRVDPSGEYHPGNEGDSFYDILEDMDRMLNP